MQQVSFIRLIVLLLLFSTPKIANTSEQDAFRAFDARQYSQSELRLVQLGLTLKEHYKGMLDGKWGRRSYSAISDYADQETKGQPQEYHAALLALAAVEFLDGGEWKILFHRSLGLSMLWTSKFVADEHSDSFLNYTLTDSSVGVSVHFGDASSTVNIHNYVKGFSVPAKSAYIVRNANVVITFGRNANGKSLYARSNPVNGRWATVLISAENRDREILAAITSSISPSRSASLDIPENGKLLAVAKELGRAIDAVKEPKAIVAPLKGSEDKPNLGPAKATGTGFYVSGTGHILTNAHVVNNCNLLTVNDKPAALITTSNNFDLALLKSAVSPPAVATFSPLTAKLNEDVTVIGYPLAGLLGGINVTRGAISSMTGLRGDELRMQISAPVQPGNSGGPVVAANGAVIGVVVSKLDAGFIQSKIGDIPQNINFAIRGSAAKLFLALHGVDPILEKSLIPEKAIALAKMASAFTVQIECR